MKQGCHTCSPVFDRSVNPISTGGAHYAHHILLRAVPDFQTLGRPCDTLVGIPLFGQKKSGCFASTYL